MKNNLNIFSALIHVISIHQTNFLSCLKIHNSSTYTTGTPHLSSCVLSPARTISYTLLLSKRAALSAEIILLSAASHHVRRPSQALRPILIRLVHFKKRLSQPPILSATNSLSLSISPLFPFLHPASSAENPSKRMLMQVGRLNPICPSRTRPHLRLHLRVPFPFPFHSIPFHSESSSLCAY